MDSMEPQKIHRCPQCGYEYEPWVEICPDCGVLIETVDVEDKKGKFGFDEDPRWTVVTNVPNAIIGNFIKGQLEDAGIPVLMQRSPSADIAQFSYNDYVPQDLRVPFNMLEDARRVLDARPDRSMGAPFWGNDLDEEDDEEDTEPPFSYFGGPSNNLPEGWTMLPTERDSRARDQYRRSHGDSEGWYWSDSTAGRGGSSPTPAGATRAESEYDFDEEPQEADKIRFSQPYEREYYDEAYGNPDRQKWIRVIYGLLLLAISLPFLFQLLQQIVSFLNFGR